MALTKNQVSELYVAIFNMASDGEGNEFWQNYEGSAADIANTMLTVSTAKDYFGDALQDNQKFIEQIYLNTLGRTYEDDPEGIDYWTGRLNEGESFGSVVVTIIEVLNGEGLEGEALENQLNFQNRVEISNYVADTVEQPLANHAEVFGFADGLAGVTADPASVEAAKQTVNEVVNPTAAISLSEAVAIIAEGGELPVEYTLDTSVSRIENNATVASASAALAVIAGAANAEEVVVENVYVWKIEDSVENIVAAIEEGAVVNASEVRVTFEEGAELSVAQAEALATLDNLAGDLPPIDTEGAIVAGLQQLETAQKEEAEFLKAQVDNELLTDLDETSSLEDIRTVINSAATTATTALASDRQTEGSDNVIAAELQDAQDDFDAAEAAVNAEAGLMAKITATVTTAEAVEAANAAADVAAAEIAGAVVTFDQLNTAVNAVYNAPKADATEGDVVLDHTAGSASTPIISVDAEGDLVVADAYADATGIDALLADAQAHFDAIKTQAAAVAAQAEANAAVVAGDEADVVTALETMAAAITNANLAADVPAATQVAVNANALTAAQKAAIDTAYSEADPAEAAEAAEAVYAPIVTAAEEAQAQAEKEEALVNSYNQEAQDLAAAQLVVTNRDDLKEAVAQTAALKAEADELDRVKDEAELALTNDAEDGGLGVNLVAFSGSTATATAEDDTLLLSAAEDGDNVVDFGTAGEDRLFIGTAFNQVNLEDDADITDNQGDVSALEVFVQQQGGDTVLFFENANFAGSASHEADLTQITLTGVTGDISISDDGFLTVA